MCLEHPLSCNWVEKYSDYNKGEGFTKTKTSTNNVYLF